MELMLLVAEISISMGYCPTGRGAWLGMEGGQLEGLDGLGVLLVIKACN